MENLSNQVLENFVQPEFVADPYEKTPSEIPGLHENIHNSKFALTGLIATSLNARNLLPDINIREYAENIGSYIKDSWNTVWSYANNQYLQAGLGYAAAIGLGAIIGKHLDDYVERKRKKLIYYPLKVGKALMSTASTAYGFSLMANHSCGAFLANNRESGDIYNTAVNMAGAMLFTLGSFTFLRYSASKFPETLKRAHDDTYCSRFTDGCAGILSDAHDGKYTDSVKRIIKG
jgi:hypothetical protein